MSQQPAPLRPRVLVIANKSWEADPLVNVLLSDRDRPDALTMFRAVNHPLIRPKDYKDPNPPVKERICFACGPANVEVWCVQDLMSTDANPSSSNEKGRVLPQVFAGDPVSAVIAFGTAGNPDPLDLNGSVVIGSRVLLHDPGTTEKTRYAPDHPDQVSDATIGKDFFRGIDPDVRFPAEGRFIPAVVEPAKPPVILAGNNWIAVSSVNVTNYDDYVWTDQQAIDAFQTLAHAHPSDVRGRIGSMESTHALIKEVADRTIKKAVPFLFVSGITDRIPLFDLQVTPRVYAQNFVRRGSRLAPARSREASLAHLVTR